MLQTLYSLSWTESRAFCLLNLFLILIKSLKIQRNGQFTSFPEGECQRRLCTSWDLSVWLHHNNGTCCYTSWTFAGHCCVLSSPQARTQRSFSLEKSEVHSTGISQTHNLTVPSFTCTEVNSTVFANIFIWPQPIWPWFKMGYEVMSQER